MNHQKKAERIVKKMYDGDAFSQWLGIDVISVSPGSAILELKVRDDMTNGFSIAHGGITYSLADSALAFASNSHGRKSVSIETSISHLEPVKFGDTLKAEAIEIKTSNRIGCYRIEIKNQVNVLVATFNGTVYRTPKEWELEV